MSLIININNDSEYLNFNYRKEDNVITNATAVFDSGSVNLIWCGGIEKLKDTLGIENIKGPVGKTSLGGFGKYSVKADVYEIKKFVLLSDDNMDKLTFLNFPIIISEPKRAGNLILPNNIFSFCDVLIKNNGTERQLAITSKKGANIFSSQYKITPTSVNVKVFLQDIEQRAKEILVG